MRTFALCRCVLSINLAGAMLVGCDGSSMPTGKNASSITNDATHKRTFYYTGYEQTFIVPAGVKQLTVIARGGAGGGTFLYPSGDFPGFPGRVYAIIRVHPGETLYVFVGGSGAHGGFNGGGAGGMNGTQKKPGNPGGGASDVRTGGDTLPDRIIVAAGGGGAGGAIYTYGYGYGGDGGGLKGLSGGGGGGSSGSGEGGGGGTQRKGGSGGAGAQNCNTSQRNGQPGTDGTLGVGGNGGNGYYFYYPSGGGGGGGGGYYGGGGGGGGDVALSCGFYFGQGGGGGGGSSYVESSAIKAHMSTGWKTKGDGRVSFQWN